MLRRFLTKILVNALAIWAADWLLGGMEVSGGWQAYLIAGLVLGLLNAFVRPVLRILTLPIAFLTLGLFSIVLNGLMLYLAARVTGDIAFAGLWTLTLATLVVTAVNILLEPGTDE
jgi:putative membrane protein